MEVSLISFTPDALDLLLFTKNTRLSLSPGLFQVIQGWPMEKKLQELEYMRNTIKSSWEFVDYVFVIEGVSRAFTHQLVRHRHASYAQQAQRVVDMTNFDYITGPSIEGNEGSSHIYHSTMELLSASYAALRENGVRAQDARGILPTNISTNIIMKVNLRALHEMALTRLCVKAQGEAQDVFRAMVDAVVEVHPWAKGFLKVWCATHGTCSFPTFPTEDCPVKRIVYNPMTGTAYDGDSPSSLEHIEIVWRNNRAEAQPVAPSKGEAE